MLNKKIFTLLVSAAFASSACAQWSKPVVSTQKDLVVGDTVYLYNTEAKMFFTEGTSTSNQWKTNANLGNEGLKVVVNQYVANEGDEWDGKTYTISDFSLQKNGWYNLFVNGAEGAYGSAFVDRGSQANYMWEMAKQANGTYHIWASGEAFGHESEGFEECYFGGIMSNGEQLTEAFPLIDMSMVLPGDVAQLDWTFVSEEEYAVYQSEYETYCAAMKLKAKIDDAVKMGVDVAGPAAVYDNTESTKDDLEAAYEEVIELIAQKDEESVTPDNPVDYTYVLTNPDFENGTTGWDNYANLSTFEVKNDWVKGDGFDNNYLNLWGGSVVGDVSQQVANIPNGIYRVSAGVLTDAAGVYFFANDMLKEVEITDGEHGYIVSLITQVTDRTLVVGLGVDDEMTHWYCMDNVKLEYIGNGTDAYVAWLKELASMTPDFDDIVAKQELVDEYLAVLNDVNNATTKEELSVLIPKYDEVSTKLMENVDAYIALENLNSKILDFALLMANEYYTPKLEAFSDSIYDILEEHVLDTEELNALIEKIERLIAESEYSAEYKTVLAAKVEELTTAANETYKDSASKESLEDAAAHIALGNEMVESNALSNDSIYNYINKADDILRELAIPTGDASDTNPLDYTILIVNPGFEDKLNGWTNEAGISTYENMNGWSENIDGEFFAGETYLNLWHGTALTGRIYQHLEGLRNGTYEVSAACYSNGEGVSLFAGNGTAAIDNLNVKGFYSVVVNVTDGTLDFGVFYNTQSEAWSCFDNFTLMYYGDKSEAQLTESNETLTGVDNVDACEAAAEYYSLSGTRLSSPVKGVNLVKKNGTVSKVVVK